MADPVVIVVGAGPVGCVAAAVLADRGIDVILLEAEPTLPLQLRASTFHPATLDLLDELGVVDEMIPKGLVADRFQYRDRRHGVVAEFDLGVVGDLTGFPFRLQCEQFKLCEILAARFESEPRVDLRYGSPVVAGDTLTDRAAVRLADGEELEADFVIAADGASSAVRKSLGIGFDGMTYADRYLVVSTPFEMADHLERLAYVNYISDPDEWLVLLRTPTVWRALFPVDDSESDNEALSDGSAERRLQGVVAKPDRYDVSHRTIYRVHQRVADRFLVGRVVLAGDAAHINNPLGGMGMNGGIHDAVLLAHGVASRLEGRIGHERLDHYAEIRRRLALDYVRRYTHENAESLAAPDGEARLRALDAMAARAADADQARDYVRQASMLKATAAMKEELEEARG